MTEFLIFPCVGCGGSMKSVAPNFLKCESCGRTNDPHFICGGCGGDIILIGEENNRKIYDCSRCKQNRMFECTVCHLPRAIWATDKICGSCALGYKKQTQS